MKRTWLVALVGIALGVGGATTPAKPAPRAVATVSPNCMPAQGMTFVCGIHHPEDIEALPGGDWAVASQTSFGHGWVGPGALVLINTHTFAIRHIASIPASSRAQPPYDACPAPPESMSPHGLALRTGSGGHHLLYVINHEREAIEMFDVDMAGKTPQLQWIGCVLLPKPIYLNAVAPTPDGGFVTTKMGDADAQPMWTRMRSAQTTGSIYRWRPGQGTPTEIPGTQGSANNGIAVDNAGVIFLSSWGTQSVVRFTPEGSGYRRDDVPVGFSTDNIKWTPDGDLLVAGQRRRSPDPSCGDCGVPWSIVRLDPKTLKVTPYLKGDGDAYSGATTGLPIGRDLWLGSFLDEKVAVVRGGYHNK